MTYDMKQGGGSITIAREDPSSDHGMHADASWRDMLSALENPSLFARWQDPQTGVESFILKLRVAPIQQSFYYVNPSLTDDGRYYWFYCAFPPAGSANNGRTLAVADLRTGRVTHFPDAQFSHASPYVDRKTGEVYWCNETGIWKRGPEEAGMPELVNRFSAGFVNRRQVSRYATHLTLSADGKAFNIDATVGNDWYVGRAPLDGGGIEIWQQMDQQYNHGQFSPADPGLMLIAQDHYVDRRDWKLNYYQNRMWTIRRGETARPVYEKSTPGYVNERMEVEPDGSLKRRPIHDSRSMHSHEWWGADGRHIWYVHHGKGHGVERVRVGTQTPELVWPHATISHAHSNRAENHLVGDVLPTSDPRERHVIFRDIGSGREINIVSQMPDMTGDARRYHIHCHPQFCFDDRLICYTAMVRGRVDVAFARVDELVRATR